MGHEVLHPTPSHTIGSAPGSNQTEGEQEGKAICVQLPPYFCYKTTERKRACWHPFTATATPELLCM